MTTRKKRIREDEFFIPKNVHYPLISPSNKNKVDFSVNNSYIDNNSYDTSVSMSPIHSNDNNTEDDYDSPYLPPPVDTVDLESTFLDPRIPLGFLKRQLTKKNYNTSPTIKRIKTGLSPEMKEFETHGNEVVNEKFSSYEFLIVHLCFTTFRYDYKYDYKNVMTIIINVDNDFEDIRIQIRNMLSLFTKSNKRRHILIFSTTILQNSEHGFSETYKSGFINLDKYIVHIYNQCLQEYSEFNIIYNNITIYHCVVCYDTMIDVPRLYDVRTKQSKAFVFNKIRNYSSIKIDDPIPRVDDLKLDTTIGIKYRVIQYINRNDQWWKTFYNELSVHAQGYLRQRSPTCWLNSIINLILLTPLSNEVKNNRDIQNAKIMEFKEIRDAATNMPLKSLLFSLFKLLLLRNDPPKIYHGDVILPIAARVNALIYRGNENNFTNNEYGNGCTRTSIATLEILKMFMEFQLISYIDIENMNTIDRALSSMKNMNIINPKKYILFCGVFTNASKIIYFLNEEYHLLGAIIRLYFIKPMSRHAICGSIINGKECITDSNGILSECTWSLCDKHLFSGIYVDILNRVSLLNCIYIKK